MSDIFLVSLFVAGAAIYLGLALRKKIRALLNPKSSAACSCGCGNRTKKTLKKK